MLHNVGGFEGEGVGLGSCGFGVGGLGVEGGCGFGVGGLEGEGVGLGWGFGVEGVG